MIKQKCPLRPKRQGDAAPDFGECMKVECAWWDDGLEMCSIRSIAGKLSEMDDKMETMGVRPEVR